MILALVALFVISIVWIFLIKGLLWKLILAIGAWFGIRYFLNENFTWASKSGVIIFDNLITWGVIIPSLLIILAMANTKE